MEPKKADPTNLIFLIAGIAFIFASVLNIYLVFDFKSNAAVADGIVIKQDHGPAHVTVEFKADGKIIRYSQKIVPLDVGEKVSVLYDAADPKTSARVDRFLSLWGAATLFSLIGFGFVGVVLISKKYPNLFISRWN